jgi:hypothetical protein
VIGTEYPPLSEGQPTSWEGNDEKRETRRESGGHREDSLIGFWLGTPMLVRDPVFVKQLFHFFCHHVTVIRNRDKGDLFAGLPLLPKVGTSRFL